MVTLVGEEVGGFFFPINKSFFDSNKDLQERRLV